MINEFKLTDKMQGNDLKKAALAYARAGIPVFPLKKKGKIPMYKGGFHKATTDLKKIKKWWDKNPYANIGSPLIEGLIVLDFDGATGLKTFEALKLKKPTLKVKTSRGFHLYYQANLVSKDGVMDCLDLKGGGKKGHIVLPPSIHPNGIRYEWDEPIKIQKLPERQVVLLQEAGDDSDDSASEAKPFIVNEGGRHQFMISTAGYLRSRGLNGDQIHDMLGELNVQVCPQPLPIKEIKGISYGSSIYKSMYKQMTKKLSDIQEQKPEFLIDPYFQRRQTNIIEGDPGVGKSSLIADITASVTTGKNFFDVKPESTGRVLFFAYEDDPSTVFKARTRMQGADDSKIEILEEPLSLDDKGFEYLNQALSLERFELVIIDTFTSVMAGRDLNKGSDMAPLIKKLNHLAYTYNTTFIIVRHLRKGGSDNALYSGQGSINVIAGVRSSLMIKKCPNNPKERFFTQNKSNGFELGQTCIFTIESVEGERTGKLFWLRKSPLTADDIVAIPVNTDDRISEAKEFLHEYLASGPVKATEVIQRAQKLEITERTLNRAKKDLNIKSSGGPGSKWSLT